MAREELRTGPFNMHWSAILSGSFVAVAAWMFFLALGAAIGGGRVGFWTAIYTLVSPILGLLCGGLVTARSRGLESRADGALHGVVVWGFAMVLGAILIASFGAAIAGANTGNFAIPRGYSWAIAGSILGSLVTAVLGASNVKTRAYERESAVAPSVRRGEVHT